MILWITGNSGSGKTTLARQIQSQLDKCVVLDGDEIRKMFKDSDLSKEGRWKHNLRIAKLAKFIHEEFSVDVIVSVIAPYSALRQEVQAITGCAFIYLKIKAKNSKFPYEYEKDKFYFTK